MSGAEKYTTNNKMELTATIKALKHLKDKSEIIIFTDSKYVIDGINNWIFKWKQNDWKTTNKKEVKNKDLWLNLYECINFHVVNWKWVKGHSGDTLNEEVDKLARGEAEKNYRFLSKFSAELFSKPPPSSSKIFLISPLSI